MANNILAGSVQSGAAGFTPLAGVPVTLYRATAGVPVTIGQAVTDQDGVFAISVPDPEADTIYYATARFRPTVPVLAVSPRQQTVRELSLTWGVAAVQGRPWTTTDEMVWFATEEAVAVGVARPGDVEHYTRVRCHRALVDEAYAPGSAVLSLLPLGPPRNGPRAVLLHAILARAGQNGAP